MQSWAFCLEQTLGHRAHGKNLESAATAAPADIAIHRVEYPERQRIPIPWALRGSFGALQSLRSTRQSYDVVLYHTQTISLLAPVFQGSKKYVVSVDATPVQMDDLGNWYSHGRGNRAAESAKAYWYRQVFRRAAAFVAWSQWAADSLVRDYQVDSERILIAHPGAGREFFEIPRPSANQIPRILFVGGDFERKGGPLLLRAFQALSDKATVTIISDAEIGEHVGVTQLRGVRPGSSELIAAYREADIFCLPTLADCTPVVLGEAMAAGLPILTTNIGSNAETVHEARTGFLVPISDERALQQALTRLVEFPEESAAMGRAARTEAVERFDAERNAARISRLLALVADVATPLGGGNR